MVDWTAILVDIVSIFVFLFRQNHTAVAVAVNVSKNVLLVEIAMLSNRRALNQVVVLVKFVHVVVRENDL